MKLRLEFYQKRWDAEAKLRDEVLELPPFVIHRALAFLAFSELFYSNRDTPKRASKNISKDQSSHLKK